MRELVIVLSDLYLSPEARHGEMAGRPFAGIEHVTRFARRIPLADGWRAWLARWLGVGAGAPATIAAGAAPLIDGGSAASFEAVWMATPVHLVAGLASVHLDRRSILRLAASELETLGAGFRTVFHDSGFRLQPLESGDFLLFGPDMSREAANARTDSTEPARVMGEMVTSGMYSGGHRPLRRLCAEIEMWLHEHPVNEIRRSRGELPVTGLWLWGGGRTQCRRAATRDAGDIVFGSDSYLQGLCIQIGATALPVPDQLASVFSYPRATRAAMALQVAHMLHSNPHWTLFDAVADIDRRFIAPAVAALHEGNPGRLVVLANDRALVLSARDRLKFWRRRQPGLTGLQ